jgi:hypothetical protein
MAKHFIGVEDYEISPTWKAPSKKRTSMALGLTALYMIRRYRSSKKKGSGSSSGRRAPQKSMDTRQRCTVKMHYSKSMEAHKEQINRYIVKEGKGKDGQAPSLYGTSEAEYRAKMTNKNFRIFLSPGTNTVPLETLAKSFISSLESQTGYKLYWVAANHYDTAHHHVHLLINGKDAFGKEVFFPPDLVKTFMRENARNICTSLIGSRTKEDLAQERTGLLTANRYTYLDDRIKEQLKNNKLTPRFTGRDSESIHTRLAHLKSLGVCTYRDGNYVFTPGWETLLRTNGRYNAFLSARKSLMYTEEQNLTLYDGSQGNVSGVITKIFRTDEVSDNHALILESIDGKAYFIPLYARPKVTGGQTIEVVPEQNQRGRLTPTIHKKTHAELLAVCEKRDFRRGFAGAVRTNESLMETNENSRS